MPRLRDRSRPRRAPDLLTLRMGPTEGDGAGGSEVLPPEEERMLARAAEAPEVEVAAPGDGSLPERERVDGGSEA